LRLEFDVALISKYLLRNCFYCRIQVVDLMKYHVTNLW